MTEIIRVIAFDEADRQLVRDALEGHEAALGVVENDGDRPRFRVGRHYNRIAHNPGDNYSAEDLRDLLEVVTDLQDLWRPQTEASWWRSQGAPGEDDAVAGLAVERAVGVARLEILRAKCVEWLAMAHGVLASS